jgi:cytochrome bd-type quinol oxidase subunit 2
MLHFVLLGFLFGHLWIYFSTKQAREKTFKKWAVPLAILNVIGMIVSNIAAFYYLPSVILMLPLHFFAVILAICNSFICVECGKWIDRDTDWFSKYKRCMKCKANEAM